MVLNKRNDAINFLDDYGSMILGVKKKATEREGIKLLSHKQMLQRLPIALAQVKAANTSENLVNKICQIIFSLYRAKKKNTEKVYDNIINSIKV